jgi:hypothetical protein
LQPPEAPRRFRLRLDVYPPPQVLQTDGRLCHFVLASRVVEGVATQQGPIAPPALPGFIATADPSATLSPSAHFPVAPVIGPTQLPAISQPGRGGFLQLLCLSLPLCRRFHPAEVDQPHRSDFGGPCCLRPSVAGSAFGATQFRGHIRVHFRYGPMTRTFPYGRLVDRLQSIGFPPPCYPSYGAPDFYPGRFISC